MQPSNRDVDLDGLQPHPKNYNRHPAEQVRRLAKSLTKFGQVRSVVVWRNTLLAGHGVAEAARILNWRTVRADVLPDDYPEHLALAYIAADNELARQGDPDMAQLAAILEQSKAADAELLEAIGYSDKEFEALLKEVGKGAAGVEDAGAQVDKAEELRQKWGTAAGQLWQLGEHRLICGDCTDPATVARVMGGEKAQAVVTSPPYGVGMEYEGAPVQADTVDLVSRCFAVACPLVVKNGFAFVNFGERYVWDMPMVQVYHGIFKALGWRWYDQRFWKRSQVGMAIWNTTQPRAMSQVEYLFTFQNGNAVYPVHDLAISKEQLWDDAGSSSDMNHPAVMALGIAEKAVTIYSSSGDVIYEPFDGSGTTIIACENLGRRCRAVEISPAYVAVALERWAMSTGKTPVLVGDNG